MKKIAIVNRHEIYNKNNNLFNANIYPIGENLEAPWVNIKEIFMQNKIELMTIDQLSLDEFDAIIFLDYPNKKYEYLLKLLEKMGKKKYLIVLESPVVCRENLSADILKKFDKIFTWSDNFFGNNVYNLKLTNKIPKKILQNNKKKLCTMISGNKKVKYSGELYSERLRALEWFEKTCPEDFDLYGVGWDYKILKFPFDRFKFIKLFFPTNYKTYKGKIEKKIDILSQYKFSICYENVKGYDGYITEKIFDCFFAGTIPIYLGADNISNYIPEETFIRKDKFPTYEDLYNYLKNMTSIEYNNYITAIKKFVENEKCREFNSEKIGIQIYNQIKNDFEQSK
ncbi:MAG: glycosyltransferase family 10 [Bacilli bacterium]